MYPALFTVAALQIALTIDSKFNETDEPVPLPKGWMPPFANW
jgi:hypothetical protein